MNQISLIKGAINLFKDTSPDNINMSAYNDVISNLKFIGRIEKGQKINTNYMLIQPDNIITSLSRTISNNDSRNKTFQFLKKNIDRSFELIEGMIMRIDTLSSSSSRSHNYPRRDKGDKERGDKGDRGKVDEGVGELIRVNCNNMISDLKSSIEGIENLKNTYITDVKFRCDMDTIIQEINAKLMNYSKCEALIIPYERVDENADDPFI